jgi:hypothetical protein
MKNQLAENTTAEKERQARKAQPERQLQSGGTIYAYKAREMVKQRDEDGGSQWERALDREVRLNMELEEMAELRENERRMYDE